MKINESKNALVAKLEDAGVPQKQAEEWVDDLLHRFWRGGYEEGREHGRNDSAKFALGYDKWMETYGEDLV